MMESSIILDLFYNIALLLVLSILYDFSWIKQEPKINWLRNLRTGILIGTIGIILMFTPWTLAPGIVFDTRSVLLSISGLFFGAFPTIIAMLITIIFRITIGGDGVVMGIAVILMSGSLGIAWKSFRINWLGRNYLLELLGLGIVVHILMLACTVLLPEDKIIDTFKAIFLPVLLIYPLGTVLLGSLMVRMYKNWQSEKAREELIESEQRFSNLMQNVSLFSVMLDTEGNILYTNRYLQKLTGYSREELLGKSWVKTFIPENQRLLVSGVLSDVVTGKVKTSQYENVILTKEGMELITEWNNVILKSENGKIIGGASIGENVTKKRMDEEQLREAKKRAEESDRLKSIFLTNMSHEIRTPMNTLLGFSELITSSSFSDAEKESYTKIIRNSGTRLLKIVDDILDISKIEAEQLSIIKKPCNLLEILTSTYQAFLKSELLAKKSGIKLLLDDTFASEDITIFTDCSRLHQVLDNLITNAIKYTEKGTILFGAGKEKTGEFIEFFVRDTGIGISEDVKDVIFERFRQVEENEFHEGTGLGLSISRGIVSLLGGNIWYSSNVGKGTTFYFTVPLDKVPSEKKPAQEPAGSESLNLEGKVVVIAEDDYNSYLLLRSYLSDTGVKIHHVADGSLLIKVVNELHPDLVLLDINMPRVSGYDFLEVVSKKKLNLKVIAQTAYASGPQRERLVDSGCHYCLVKPISKKELFKAISATI